MYEQSKQEYAKYEPNASYAQHPAYAPPPGYAPVQPYPYASYPPYRRRSRRMMALLLAAVIVAALMFAAIASSVGRDRFGGSSFAQAAPYPLGAMVKACNTNDAKCVAVPGFQQPIASLAKPNAPSTKPCDPSDSACIANQQQSAEPAALPDGVNCNPCLWTSSPDYQASGPDGNPVGAYHIYNMESLNTAVDAAIKHDLAAGWSLNVETGSHDRALVFTDLGMICEVNDQCHQIGKLYHFQNVEQ